MLLAKTELVTQFLLYLLYIVHPLMLVYEMMR